MSLEQALSLFPVGSIFRDFVRDLATGDEACRLAANRRARTLEQVDNYVDAHKASWFVSEADAIAILKAAQTLEFPLPKHQWEDGLHAILFLLVRSPYPSLVPLIEPLYAKMPDGRRRDVLLATLGAIATREAAEAFMACIRHHGWPSRAYPRVFSELFKLMAFGEVMLPDVLLTAGDCATDVGDVIIAAIAQGTIEPHRLVGQLDALAPFVIKNIKSLMKKAGKHQKAKGIEWRFAEKYYDVRHRLCMLVDLAGRLEHPKLPALLREVLEFADPRIVTFAALALLRHGQSVGKAPLNISARCHETRTILFEGLRLMKMEDRFPKKWRTWEAFGAAHMVEWLMYPAELGREPDELELGHTEWLDKRRKVVAYVWKFRVAGEPWLAGVSGPHELRGDPQPVDGGMTFSRFDEWASATPEAHLEKCAGTVDEFLQAHPIESKQ